jgi:hypothetical protein
MMIEIDCSRCGENDFGLNLAADDLSLVICQRCGQELGTLGEVKRRVAEHVLASNGFGPRPV